MCQHKDIRTYQSATHTYIYVYAYIYIYKCLCVCTDIKSKINGSLAKIKIKTNEI